MSFCQFCRAPLFPDGSHPPSNCPVYTGLPVPGDLANLAVDYNAGLRRGREESAKRIAGLEASLSAAASKEANAMRIISDLMNRIAQLQSQK